MAMEEPENNAIESNVRYVFEALDKAKRQMPEAHVVASPRGAQLDIEQEITREQKLKNDNIEQDIKLKRETLNRLFVFLALETALIFIFAFAQAIHWPAHFNLEEWSFRLLVTVTILQITGMLYVAVRYLFPKNNQE
jgi:hypothetical protein